MSERFPHRLRGVTAFCGLALLACGSAVAAWPQSPSRYTADVQVSVVRAEDGAPIPGALVTLTATFMSYMSRAQYSELPTDATGVATASQLANILTNDDLRLQVTAVGFEAGDVTVKTPAAPTGLFRTTVKLKRLPGVLATVSVFGSDGNPLRDATVSFAGRPGTLSQGTNFDGVATLHVPVGGLFTLTVTQDQHETYSAPVTLDEKTGTFATSVGLAASKKSAGTSQAGVINVRVTTMQNGKTAQVPNAKIVIGQGVPVTTNARGFAQIPHEFYAGEDVSVRASAAGYKPQLKIITPIDAKTWLSRSTTEALVFVLEPGEPEDTPIQIVVEVKDAATGTPLDGARVSFYTMSGKLLHAGNANLDGERRFDSTFPGAEGLPLADLRAGIRVDVTNNKYKSATGLLIDSSLLKPSSDPVRFYVGLDATDGLNWPDFEKAVNTLHARYLAWQKLQADLKALAKRADGAVAEVEALRTTSRASVPQMDELRKQCLAVKNAVDFVEIGVTESTAAEGRLRDALDRAGRTADRCSTPADAASIRTAFAAALKEAANIASAEKTVQNAVATGTARGPLDLTAAIETVSSGTRAAFERVIKLHLQLQADYRSADVLVASIGLAGRTIRGDLGILRAKWGIGWDPSTGHQHARLTAALKAQLDAIQGMPANPTLPVMSSAEKLQLVETAMGHMLADADSALLLSKHAVSCTPADVLKLTAARGEMADLNASATIELAAAANLPAKAAQCEANGACQPLLGGVRASLERGDFAIAEKNISEARTRGCDVTAATEELDYFRAVRDAAAAIDKSGESCNFQAAMDFAATFPASIREREMVRRAMIRARDGLAAAGKIRDLLARARTAASSGQDATAQSLIASAEREALPWSCLRQAAAADIASINAAKGPVTPPGPGRPTDPPKAGTLTRVGEVWVKKNERNDCCGGSSENLYSETTAEIDSRYPPNDGGNMKVEWSFAGVPTTLTPGEEFEITVKGSAKASMAGRKLPNGASGGVRVVGLTVIKAQNMFINVDETIVPGVFKFKVPDNATNVTIELGADNNLGVFAIYKYAVKR